MLGRPGAIDRRTGRVVTSDPYVAESVRTAPYAVAPTALELAGKVIAKPGSFLALYRVDHPLRLAQKATGLYSDGWTAGDMALSQYATPGQRSGRLVVRLLRPTLVRRGLVGPALATLETRAPAGRGRRRGRVRRPHREAFDPPGREPTRRVHVPRPEAAVSLPAARHAHVQPGRHRIGSATPGSWASSSPPSFIPKSAAR